MVLRHTLIALQNRHTSVLREYKKGSTLSQQRRENATVAAWSRDENGPIEELGECKRRVVSGASPNFIVRNCKGI